MINPAWAQAGGAADAPSFALQMLPLVLIFAVFYFLLIRPQQARARQHQEMLANLKRNDTVVTSGGIHGRSVTVGDQVLELEVAPNVRLRVDRAQIGAVVGKAPGNGEKAKEKEKAK